MSKEFFLDLDRRRKLIFDFNAWDIIAEHLSPDGKTFDPTAMNITYRELPILAYAGLKWEDESLTLEKTKQLLNEAIRQGKLTILQIMTEVTGAMFAQSGVEAPELKLETKVPEFEDAPKNPEAAVETGSGSKEN